MSKVIPVVYDKIEELGIYASARVCLSNAGIVYITDLITKTEADLLKINHIGPLEVRDIKRALVSYNDLHLEGEESIREFLGTVETSKGTYKVYMPNVMDILDLNDLEKHYVHRLCAIAVGISFEDFIKWSMVDGGKVSELLGRGLTEL